MSTVTYRDGVMAADTRAYAGDKTPLGYKVKIRRLDDGTLVGASSCAPGECEAAMDWYADGADPDKAPFKAEPKFTMLAVRPDGSAFYVCCSWLRSGPLRAPWFAIGSGEQYAIGALIQGATATQAVKAAVVADVWTDGPVTLLRHT